MKWIISIALLLCLFSCDKKQSSAVTAPDFDEYRERYLRMGFESGYLNRVVNERLTPCKNADDAVKESKLAADKFISAMSLK